MPEVTSHDGLRLQVNLTGDQSAPVTVVLVHSWTADQRLWRYQVLHLLQTYGHRIRVVTWDHRGHGRSERSPESACTVENLARDLGSVIDACAPTGRLVIAGHSIGGMTMTMLPRVRPDLVARISGLLFVSTSSGRLNTVTLGLPDPGPRMRARLPELVSRRARRTPRRERLRRGGLERRIMTRFVFGNRPRQTDLGLAMDQLLATPPETVSGFFRDMMQLDTTAGLKAYDDIATIVVVGSRDRLTPPRHGRDLAEAIRGARFEVLPDAGHQLPLERDEAVNEALDELIARAERDAGD